MKIKIFVSLNTFDLTLILTHCTHWKQLKAIYNKSMNNRNNCSRTAPIYNIRFGSQKLRLTILLKSPNSSQ